MCMPGLNAVYVYAEELYSVGAFRLAKIGLMLVITCHWFASGLPRCFAVKTAFPWVTSRATMLYLAARTHSRAAVCLHAAHIAALRELWTEWLPTETPL